MGRDADNGSTGPKKRKRSHAETQGQHPNQPQLCAPWKKGQSGNPRGRPKGAVSLITVLKRRLRDHPEEAEKIIDTLIKEATTRGGKQVIHAIALAFERVDGRVPDAREIEQEAPRRVVIEDPRRNGHDARDED